jgi:hypothetical protein
MEADKIYWIEGDFKFVGHLEEEFGHSVSRITEKRVDEHFIKIIAEPTDFGEGKESYRIQLTRDKGYSYGGDFRDLETGDISGTADAELFLNQEGWILIGNWYEEDEEGETLKYTWIVKVKDKNAWQHFLKK